jgi:hypothetical protein
MSPDGQTRRELSSNIYTIILALALCVVLATAVFVACECYFQYGTIFKIP